MNQIQTVKQLFEHFDSSIWVDISSKSSSRMGYIWSIKEEASLLDANVLSWKMDPDKLSITI